MAKVYVNKHGKFMCISEISSHSASRTFAYTWVDLSEASVVADDHNLATVNWKDRADFNGLVMSLPAKEIKSVELCEAEWREQLFTSNKT